MLLCRGCTTALTAAILLAVGAASAETILAATGNSSRTRVRSAVLKVAKRRTRKPWKVSMPDAIRHVTIAIVASNDPKKRVLGIKVARCIIIAQIDADIHVASGRASTHVQPSERY